MRFDEIKIGHKETIEHTITSEDINTFATLTGDNNRLHVDDAYAKSLGYGKQVAHGMLGASFISTIIGTKIPGDGALWYSQNINFILPVRDGDTLTVTAEVVDKNKRDSSIRLKTDIINQHGKTVISGHSDVKVLEPVEDKEDVTPEPSGLTALVIGGTGGIGKDVCYALAEEGFHVVVVYYKNQILANSICEDIKSRGHSASNIRIDDVSTILDVDVLVNCSAVPIIDKKVIDVTFGDMSDHIRMNIYENIELIQTVLPYMKLRKYGKIITIGSSIVDKPSGHLLPYITAKSALWGMTKALSFELAPQGIRVNMVTPSMVETDLTIDIPQRTKLIFASQSPLRRLTTPNDIASVISFLASRSGDAVTGQNIRVN